MAKTFTALITGGSSGIGAAFARYLALNGEKVLITGRRESEIKAVCSAINKETNAQSCDYLLNDLTNPADRNELCHLLGNNLQLNTLVNNAGFNIDGRFHEIDLSEHQSITAVHIEAVIELTHAAMPHLLTNKGRLINVASVAAFLPTPLAPLYGPSKAFIYSFTQTLAANYHRDGVRCLSLCPGFVRTDFHKKLGLSPEHFYKSRGLTKAYSPEYVVTKAMKDLENGKSLSVPGWNYRLLVTLLSLLPRSLLFAASRRIRKPRAN